MPFPIIFPPRKSKNLADMNLALQRLCETGIMGTDGQSELHGARISEDLKSHLDTYIMAILLKDPHPDPLIVTLIARLSKNHSTPKTVEVESI